MIEGYINRIDKITEFDEEQKPVVRWRFAGDGNGDWEKVSDSATRSAVEEYISELSVQRMLAEEYLRLQRNTCGQRLTQKSEIARLIKENDEARK